MSRSLVDTKHMKRILVIGSSGSGKSTLARSLEKKIDVPVIHLDKHFWQPGWVGTPEDTWREKVTEFVNGSSWIMDGNYRSTLDMRMASADTVIFLDLPPWVCVWRAVKRRFMYLNRPRPDIAPGCRERILDPQFPEFIRWILNYPYRAKPDVLSHLIQLEDHQRIVWLQSTQQVKTFLEAPLDPQYFLTPTGLQQSLFKTNSSISHAAAD